jgi:hypothetical protein
MAQLKAPVLSAHVRRYGAFALRLISRNVTSHFSIRHSLRLPLPATRQPLARHGMWRGQDQTDFPSRRKWCSTSTNRSLLDRRSTACIRCRISRKDRAVFSQGGGRGLRSPRLRASSSPGRASPFRQLGRELRFRRRSRRSRECLPQSRLPEPSRSVPSCLLEVRPLGDGATRRAEQKAVLH